MDIESSDIIRLIEQFLREQQLPRTLKCLQEETGIALNTTDNADQFIGNIQQGRWDQVLRTVAQMNLPAEKLIDLYEQIIIELIELGEMIAARQLLRETSIMQQVRDHQTDRYLHLEHSLSLTAHFDPVEAYGVEGKRRRRLRLAESLAVEMTRVQPGRLLALLGQALRWQQTQGLLPQPSATTASIATTTTAATITADSIAAQRMDLFRGIFQPVRADSATLAATESTLTDGRDSVVPTEGIRCYATIKFGRKHQVEAAVFSPDGKMLVTGTVDGFIEVWNPSTGKLCKDLVYQAEERYMCMEAAVLALAFSADGQWLASGSQSGQIKVWRSETGACLRQFDHAHSSSGITSIQFSPDDGSQVLTTGYDQLIRIHGLRSGTDAARIMSGSSDGTVRIWDCKSGNCLHEIRFDLSGSGPAGSVRTISQLLAVPCSDYNGTVASSSSSTVVLVCMASPVALLVDADGVELERFNSQTAMDFHCGAWRGQLSLLLVSEDGRLYTFRRRRQHVSAESPVAEPISVIKLTEESAGIIGICQSPDSSILACFTDDGNLRLWK